VAPDGDFHRNTPTTPRGETQLFEKKAIGARSRINLRLMHFDGLYATSNAAMVDA
jgi:hypothetical protein